MPKLIIYTDGGARGNPGPAAAGIVAFEGSEKVFEFNKYLGERQTNNWAEYEAVALALAEAKKRGLTGRELEVRMDSKLVVEQVMGNWKIKELSLKPQLQKVKDGLVDFPKYTFVYVPRAENAEADALVNECLDEQL